MRSLHRIGITTVAALSLGFGAVPARAEPFDEQFLDSMTPHHHSGVVMAQMAVTMAKYPEVRALARGIVADQKKEIAYMAQLRKRFYGSATAPSNSAGMKMGGMTMKGGTMTMPGTMMGLPMKGAMNMGRLGREKGANFDKMFLKMMIPHHAGAILMANEALNVSARPEIRRLSDVIIDAQAKEIGQMRTIYNRHFGSLAKS